MYCTSLTLLNKVQYGVIKLQLKGNLKVIIMAKETWYYKSHVICVAQRCCYSHDCIADAPLPFWFLLGRGYQQLYHPAVTAVIAQCNTASDEWCDAQCSPAIRRYCQPFCFINGNTGSFDSHYKHIRDPWELRYGYLCCSSGCVFLWSVSPYCGLCVLYC